MKDRKSYWREYQRTRYEARKLQAFERLVASGIADTAVSTSRWLEFEQHFRQTFKSRGLSGQANWRARAKLRAQLLHEWGLSDLLKPNAWADVLFRRAKASARARKLPFTLAKTDLVLPTECPILKFPLDYPSLDLGVTPQTPSVDRINNALGYVPGNVQVISHRANKLKNDATLEELHLLGLWAGTLR